MADGVKKVNEFIIKEGRVIGVTTPNYPAGKLEPGTLYINPGTGKFEYVDVGSGNKMWKPFDPNTIFEQQTIVTRLLKDKSVTTAKLDDKCVTTIKLGDKQITTIKYADLSVTNSVLGNDSVDRNKIKDLEVITSKLQNGGVTTEKIKDMAVTGEKIALETVLNKHIGQRAINCSRIEEKTITRKEIKNGEICEELIEDLSVTNSKLGTNSVSEVKLLNNCVTHHKLGIAAVYGNKIKDLGVEDSHIKDMNGAKIIDGTISASELGNSSVTNSKIANESVSMNKLDNNTATLIEEAIRVKATQNIDGSNVANTALCKGNMRIKANSGQATLKVDGSIVADGNITGARVYNPVFSDIAEGYVPVGDLKPGDPVSLCIEGGLRVEKTDASNCIRFLGFVSNEYACCYGATPEELESGEKIAIALVGRIHVNRSLFAFVEHVVPGKKVELFNGKFYAENTSSKYTIGKVLDIREDKVLIQVWPN